MFFCGIVDKGVGHYWQGSGLSLSWLSLLSSPFVALLTREWSMSWLSSVLSCCLGALLKGEWSQPVLIDCHCYHVLLGHCYKGSGLSLSWLSLLSCYFVALLTREWGIIEKCVVWVCLDYYCCHVLMGHYWQGSGLSLSWLSLLSCSFVALLTREWSMSWLSSVLSCCLGALLKGEWSQSVLAVIAVMLFWDIVDKGVGHYWKCVVWVCLDYYCCHVLLGHCWQGSGLSLSSLSLLSWFLKKILLKTKWSVCLTCVFGQHGYVVYLQRTVVLFFCKVQQKYTDVTFVYTYLLPFHCDTFVMTHVFNFSNEIIQSSWILNKSAITIPIKSRSDELLISVYSCLNHHDNDDYNDLGGFGMSSATAKRGRNVWTVKVCFHKSYI